VLEIRDLYAEMNLTILFEILFDKKALAKTINQKFETI